MEVSHGTGTLRRRARSDWQPKMSLFYLNINQSWLAGFLWFWLLESRFFFFFFFPEDFQLFVLGTSSRAALRTIFYGLMLQEQVVLSACYEGLCQKTGKTKTDSIRQTWLHIQNLLTKSSVILPRVDKKPWQEKQQTKGRHHLTVSWFSLRKRARRVCSSQRLTGAKGGGSGEARNEATSLEHKKEVGFGGWSWDRVGVQKASQCKNFCFKNGICVVRQISLQDLSFTAGGVRAEPASAKWTSMPEDTFYIYLEE